MQRLWEFLLPGFTFISWGTYFLGLVESFIGGFLTAALFVPIYNYLAASLPRETSTPSEMTQAGQHS